MPDSKRAVYLVDTVNQVIREHSIWNHSETAGVHPQSMLGKALAEMFDAYRIGDIPEACRPLERIIARLEPEWNAYLSQVESTGREDTPPGNAFWRPFQELVAAAELATAPVIPLLPTPKHYYENEKLSPQQIAKIYDWKDWRGAPDVNRVLRELQTPSKEFKDGVPNPLAARLERERAIQQQRLEDSAAKQEKRRKQLESVAPESIEELVLQKVSPAQICRMKKLTMPALEKYCADNGLSLLQPEPLPEPVESRSTLETAVNEALESFDDADVLSEMSLEEQIIAAHDADPSLTATALSELFDGQVTPNKVGRILKRRNEIVGAEA